MTQNNLKIAITGGIGSGKSTVTQIIEEHGYKVLSCDEIYKELLTRQSFINEIADKMGEEFVCQGKLDRKKLSAAVFLDKQKLEKLNSVTHPAIMREMLKNAGDGITFCEVPLLFESGFEGYFDKIIVVLRPKPQRIESIVKRDKITENEAILRINSQFNYDNYSFTEYYVIHNDGNLQILRQKTEKILEELICSGR